MAFNFESGKSYFKAFRLPELSLPYNIKITSYALGDTIREAHIFYPRVALLDEYYAVIWQSAPADFEISRMGFGETASATGGLPVKLEGTVVVDSPNQMYALIYTTRQLMDTTTPYITLQTVPVIVPGLVTVIPTGKQVVQIRHSPFGLLRVEIITAVN